MKTEHSDVVLVNCQQWETKLWVTFTVVHWLNPNVRLPTTGFLLHLTLVTIRFTICSTNRRPTRNSRQMGKGFFFFIFFYFLVFYYYYYYSTFDKHHSFMSVHQAMVLCNCEFLVEGPYTATISGRLKPVGLISMLQAECCNQLATSFLL